MYRWLAITASTLFALAALVIWQVGRADADIPPTSSSPLLASEAPVMVAAPAQEPTAPPRLVEDDVFVAPAARPAPPRTAEQKRLARYDRDNDQQISQAEFLANSRAAFNRRDLNGDGKLDFAEYAAKRIEMFSSADGDGTGNLDPVEFATTRTKPSTTRKACPEPAQPESEA